MAAAAWAPPPPRCGEMGGGGSAALAFSPGSGGGGWIKRGRGRRKRQRTGWSRSCSEVALSEAAASALGGGRGRAPVSPGSVDGQTAGPSRSSAPPDTVKFGEVALQPPKLTAKPKTSVSRGQVSSGGGRAWLVPGEHAAVRPAGALSPRRFLNPSRTFHLVLSLTRNR